MGNVYDVKFTADPVHFLRSGEQYSMKTEVLFARTVKRGNQTAWKKDSIESVKRNYGKNNIMVTRMALRRNSGQNGGFYDQNAVRGGCIPLKGDPRMANTQRYGGYNGDTGAYMFLVEHGKGKKRVRSLEPMYLRYAEKTEGNPAALKDYCRQVLRLDDPQIIIPQILFKTLMEIKGFRFWLTGRADSRVLGSQAFQLVLSPSAECYVKKILKVNERLKSNKADLTITKAYDRVSSQENIKLYDLFTEKLQITTYCTRPSSPLKTLKNGREKFISLSLAEQCAALTFILSIFRGNGQTDLSLLGGSTMSGKVRVSKNIGVDFKIIYQSITGFYSHEDGRLSK